jgi:hypothetical protein
MKLAKKYMTYVETTEMMTLRNEDCSSKARNVFWDPAASATACLTPTTVIHIVANIYVGCD